MFRSILTYSVARAFSRARISALGCGLMIALAGSVAPAHAQDFMFGTPNAWLRFDAGMSFASANSDVFDDFIERLTLEKSDFRAIAFGLGLGVPVSERVDIEFNGRFAGSSTQSEYQDYYDQDELPILQTTRLSVVPITVGPRYNLKPSGREISEFAWIPARWVPYVGAAAGFAWYRFEQEGDFIDESDPILPIYNVLTRSEGWFLTGHAFAGVDYNVSNRLALNLEARYALGSAELDRIDYANYEPIDLSGFWATVGLSLRL